MRHAELFRLAKAMDQACAQFWDAAPPQGETIDDLTLVWYVVWEPRWMSGPVPRLRATVRTDYPTAGDQLERQHNLPPALVARRDEIAEQLRRWEKNEADWPLGALPPKDQP